MRSERRAQVVHVWQQNRTVAGACMPDPAHAHSSKRSAVQGLGAVKARNGGARLRPVGAGQPGVGHHRHHVQPVQQQRHVGAAAQGVDAGTGAKGPC